jgi:hypothetical protein
MKFKSVMMHELTHLYELYQTNRQIKNTDWEIQSGITSFKIENNVGTFNYFLDMCYISFKQELRSRTSQLYYEINKDIFTKDILIKRLKETTQYKNYLNLLNFNYIQMINYYENKSELDLLIAYVNLLNKHFKSKTIIKNKSDLINYFKKWNFHFKDSAKKYYKKMLKVVDEIIEDELQTEDFSCTKDVDYKLLDIFNSNIKDEIIFINEKISKKINEII